MDTRSAMKPMPDMEGRWRAPSTSSRHVVCDSFLVVSKHTGQDSSSLTQPSKEGVSSIKSLLTGGGSFGAAPPQQRVRELQQDSFRDAIAWPHRSELWPSTSALKEEPEDHSRISYSRFDVPSESGTPRSPRPRSLTEVSVSTTKPWQLVRQPGGSQVSTGPTIAVAPGGTSACSTEVSRAWQKQKHRDHTLVMTKDSSLEPPKDPPPAAPRPTAAGPLSRAGRNLSSVRQKSTYKDWIREQNVKHLRNLCSGLANATPKGEVVTNTAEVASRDG